MQMSPRAAVRPIERGPGAGEFYIVTRRIDWSLQSLRRHVDVLASGSAQLRLDRPFVAVAGRVPGWQTTGRLYAHGPGLVRFTPVEIELGAWSPEVSALSIRPATRKVTSWGTRRLRRYFAVAHRTADELVRALDAVADDNPVVATAAPVSEARKAG
jgi:hypothetical protein